MQDRIDDEVEAIAITKVLDVVERACGKVVEHPHLVAFIEQQFGEVGADESSATGD
jgi:hypothetical protein